MRFSIINHDFKYELEKVARLFMPFQKFEFENSGEETDGVYTALFKGEDTTELVVCLNVNDVSLRRTAKIDNKLPDYEDTAELTLASMLYKELAELTSYTPEWGMVTGIRPVRLLERLIELYGNEGAENYLKNSLYVAQNKVDLCRDCLKKEDKIISSSKPRDFSLYVSIPFCPSRCSYCSFVSHSVEQAKKLIPEYLELLCREIKETAEIAKRIGLNLRTVYIGGGTPTSLSAEQLRGVMTVIKENFDISSVEEYTVEAGRPDTVTREKLEVIKQLGATRISINPQTMNDDVLNVVGRRHTAEDTVTAFRLAREVGFDNINMDLIAGLTGDTLQSFKASVDSLISLDPENITVHTLSMKRASNMTKESMFFGLEEGKEVAEMVDYAKTALETAEIYPYYMYRQGKTVGNLENVGYAKEGFEGIYNIFIMDETHTILACGASAVTKMRQPGTNRIERVFNYKYPYEYINSFDEMLQRKKAIEIFYSTFQI